jgi:hypothetical protein
LTFIDRYILTSFAFVLSVTFAVSIIHLILTQMGDESTTRLQAKLRWAFPAVSIATIVAMPALTLRRHPIVFRV